MSCSHEHARTALKRRQYAREYRSFIERLKAARVDAGLTQVQAAAKLGVAQSFISKCESGERRVDVIELQMFTQIYGKHLQDFL
jgi:transcriptional regulator with XRE-family HTH domain